jgi:hypothetical protein
MDQAAARTLLSGRDAILLIHVNETDENFRFSRETSVACRHYGRKRPFSVGCAGYQNS